MDSGELAAVAFDPLEACRAVGRLGIRSLALARFREPLCETTIVRRRRAGRERRAVLVRILRLLLTLFTFTNLGKTIPALPIPPLASVHSFISNSPTESQSVAVQSVGEVRIRYNQIKLSDGFGPCFWSAS